MYNTFYVRPLWGRIQGWFVFPQVPFGHQRLSIIFFKIIATLGKINKFLLLSFIAIICPFQGLFYFRLNICSSHEGIILARWLMNAV